MRLGDALMEALGGEGDEYDSPRDAAAELVEHYGSVAGAARALDVPRRTLRGWLAGKTPRGGGGWLGDIAREFDRAGRLDEDDQDRIRSADSEIEVTGTFRYNGGGSMKGAEDRTISLGTYLAPGTMSRVLDLYLGGADADDLARAFHDGINDQGFYADTFDPDNSDGYWDVDSIGGLM